MKTKQKMTSKVPLLMAVRIFFPLQPRLSKMCATKSGLNTIKMANRRTYITMNFQATAAHPEKVVTAGETLRDPIEAKRAVAEVIIDYELNILKM